MYKKVFPALLVGLIAVPTIGAVRKDSFSSAAEATGITQVEPSPSAPSASTGAVDEHESVITESTSTHHDRPSVLRTAAASAMSSAVASADAVAPAAARSIPPTVTVESDEPAATPEAPATEAPATETPADVVDADTETPARPTSATGTAATDAPAGVVDADTVKPSSTLVSPTTVGPFNAVAIQVDAADNHGLARVTANIYQGSTLVKSTSTRVDGKTTASHTATVNLPSGSYTIRYNASDNAGNVSTTKTMDIVVDADAPTATVKPESVGADGVYRTVSYKLTDAGEGQIDYVTINGVKKDLSNNKWSDVNGMVPGVFGAQEGKNTLVVFDTAGNSSSYTFVLDTKGPEVTVKSESVGTNGVYSKVSYKLHDAGMVDKVTINGVVKDLDNNEWSDVNGIVPGVFGAKEGANVLVAYDAVGNTTTVEFELDTVAPTATVKPESVGADGVYRTVSYKLTDAGEGQIDYVTINGVKKDLSNNKWSDVNGMVPGVFGAQEGKNTLVVFDTAGNSSSYTFVLDTKGPEVTVKPESVGANGVYSKVSYKLHDAGMVDKVTINGVVKDLSNNEWSDVNGIVPGVFGAKEGANVLVAHDALGNTTTITFKLDTVAPTAVEVIVPEVIVPEVIVPEVIVPEVIVPEVIVPEVIVPEVIVPEAIVPEAIVPEAIVPEAIVPEAIVPEAIAPDATDS